MDDVRNNAEIVSLSSDDFDIEFLETRLEMTAVIVTHCHTFSCQDYG